MWWTGVFQQAPSRKCSARLDALHLDASLTALNLARRKLYDGLESQLTLKGLSVGKKCRALLVHIFKHCSHICHPFIALRAPSRPKGREKLAGVSATLHL